MPILVSRTRLLCLSIYAVNCEGVLRAEAAAAHVAPNALRTLRMTAARTEQSLERQISFASKEERVPRRSRASLSGDDMFQRLPTSFSVHVLRRHGHTFTVLTVAGFEADLASRFCEEACEAYAAAIKAAAEARPSRSAGASAPVSISTTASSGGLFSWRRSASSRRGSGCSTSSAAAADEETAMPGAPEGFASVLETLLMVHAKPERLQRARRLRQVNDQTREVTNVMEETVDRMLANGQNLHELEDKSEWLLAQATAFQRSTREYRRLLCCQSIKLSIVIYGGCVLLVVAAILVVLWQLGVLGGGSGAGGGGNATGTRVWRTAAMSGL